MMSDPTIDPVEEENQQRKAKHEAEAVDNNPVGLIEEAVAPLVRPFAREQLSEEDVEEQREQADEEERPS